MATSRLANSVLPWRMKPIRRIGGGRNRHISYELICVKVLLDHQFASSCLKDVDSRPLDSDLL